MKVDSSVEGQGHSCPRDFVKPVQLDMDDNVSQRTPGRPLSGSRVSTKSKAPSPPVSVKGLDGAGLPQRHSVSAFPLMTMDQKENLLEQDLTLVVVLPGGVEKTATVHGSKPMMDLLVMLCAKYHLNPSGYIIELVTTNRNPIKFKPNTLIGALEAEKVLLKPKGMEDKIKKPIPQMPEATVRLVINYKKTQKTILRVSPRVPLEDLLPAICEKCEFDRQSTLLLRDAQSKDPLDLTCSLNDFAIREVYARDTKAMHSEDVPASPTTPTTPTHLGHLDTIPPSKDKTQKEKENKGLFSLFRRSKKKPEQGMTASAPASPVFPSKPRPLSMSSLSAHSSTFNCSSMASDMPKKRRAPLPPMLVSQSFPSNLSHRQRSISASEPEAQKDSDQMAGLSRSTESSLKRTKRKAPPPPASPSVVVQDEASLDGGGQLPNTLEEIVEQEETTASVVLDSMSDVQEDDSSLNLSTADISVDSERTEALSPPLEAPDTPYAETETSSPPESEGPAGEDQACDLSSDGKLVHSMVNNTDCTEPMLIAADGSPESPPCQAEEISGQTDLPCKDYTTQDGVKGECSTESSPTISPPAAKPVKQSTGTQASDQLDTDPSYNERPVATSTPCPPAEDAQVQTDLTPPCPVSPPQQQEVPPPAKASTSGAVGLKKDMATSTEELLIPADPITPALSPASAVPQCQTSAQSAPAPLKPSNELTRDYIPKVGMTTYTIMPHKCLEKRRYFEVELMLESPDVALEKEVGSLELKDCTTQAEQLKVTAEQTELQSIVPKENSQSQQVGSTTTTTTTTTTTSSSKSTVNGNVVGPIHSPSTPTTILPAGDDKIPSPSSGGDKAGSIAEVKEMKIPPVTKPKPGSFRLPQHKRTPGYYVTSAAVKSLSANPGAGQREAPGSLVAAVAAAQALQPVEEGSFPPPPPPVQWDEETSEVADVVDVEPSVPSPRPSPARAPPSPVLNLEKRRSFAAPKPYSPTTPSRFAQAVTSAVKRSQSLSTGSTSPSPRSPPFYPITSRFLVNDPKGPCRVMGSDNGEGEENKGLELQGGGDLSGGPVSDNMTVQMAGQSDPEQRLSVCGEELSSNGSTETSTEPDGLPWSLFEHEPRKEE
ncbi:cordon-bleu protein-like 1 isoform X2 [Coregonus clupeaformis]|uniref:cordon-bleu protein-like 1 isoform X2 n=1 Tax=Coregonus clupeaformis TaxID=59861 RepID=UPI001BDF8A6D|nr:cordon-bleu protein-like 1 isoform X2 [Coregonus clupeaformis]